MRLIALLLACLPWFALAEDATTTAQDIIRKAMDHYRGQTSYSEMTMVIHRPDWERSMTMRGWSKGEKNTLVRVTEPKKDAGNGTLSVDGKCGPIPPRSIA